MLQVSLSKEAHAISTNGSQMIIHHHDPHSEEPAASKLDQDLVIFATTKLITTPGCFIYIKLICSSSVH
jgi:hypothetical protein